MAPRLALCLLLACVALPAAARDVALLAANGAGAGCPVVADADDDENRAAGTAGKPVVAPGVRAKPPARRGGGDAESAARPPRWHSFLPGMIR